MPLILGGTKGYFLVAFGVLGSCYQVLKTALITFDSAEKNNKYCGEWENFPILKLYMGLPYSSVPIFLY